MRYDDGSQKMNDAAIALEQVSKRYELFPSPRARFWQLVSGGLLRRGTDFWALRDVSFEVRRGETFGIVGRNGAGKSTLLQLICGVLQPTSGRLQVRGRVTALLELGAGLNPEFDGLENIRMSGAVLGINQSEVEEKLDKIIEFAQLGDFLHRPVKTYSSGMMMRLAFSAAINFDPDILVIDEALAVGDELFQLKCLRRIDEIKRSGATILFVSHSMHSINQICDRALLLDGGRVVSTGTAKVVTEKYNTILYGLPGAYSELRAPASANDDVPRESVVASHPALPCARIERSNLQAPRNGQEARIESVALVRSNGNDTTLFAGEEVTLIARTRFLIEAQDVIFGMMITTPTGVDCYHTNLLCRGELIKHCSPGDVFDVSYRFRADLGPGSYVVVFDCQRNLQDSPRLVDIFYEAMHFRVGTTALIEDGGIAALRAEVSFRKAV